MSLQYQISFQIVSSYTRKRPCFQHFLCSSKPFEIPSIYAPFTVLVFIIFSAAPNRFKYRQSEHFTVLAFVFFLCSSKSFHIPSECTIYRPCFRFISLPGIYRRCFYFNFFSVVQNRFRCCQNAYTVLVFKSFFCSSKSLQISSECTLGKVLVLKNSGRIYTLFFTPPCFSKYMS